MQTPYLPKKIFGDDFERVYEPAEDSFILLDALEQDLDLLRNDVTTCIEFGSGSGIVITALSNALRRREKSEDGLQKINHLLLATDLNLDACQTTKKCTDYFGVGPSVQVVRTNLAESLLDRLENSVDLLIFNPPYVPTPDDELSRSRRPEADQPHIHEGQLHLSWAGGCRGRSLIDLFLTSYVPHLLSKPNGRAYMVALDKNDPENLSNCLKEKFGIRGSIAMERKAGIEHLYVLRYEWLQ